MLEGIIQNVRERVPLIHCITNYVTVNDVANILLACGGSPIMADDHQEVEEITSICAGLDINIGTLNSRTISSMLLAGKQANRLGHITVLDPVGAGASQLRTNTAKSLLEEVKFTVIRGNSSEIKTIAAGKGNTQGVDANELDAITEQNLPQAVEFATKLSESTGSTIAITGAIDLVCDTTQAYVIRNGHPVMSKITGTGCMLTGVIAAYCAANSDRVTEATVAAIAAMGLCGELAYQKICETNGGTSSFRTYLIDAMSKMEDDILKGGVKIEVYTR